MKTKQCTKCKKIKPTTEFYNRNSGKYLYSACKECDNYYRKQREERRLGRKIGVRNSSWKKKEIELLLNLYNTNLEILEISKILNRSAGAISTKLWNLGKAGRLIKWSVEDKEYLKNNFYKQSLDCIAKKLNRSLKSIQHAAIKQKLIFRKTTWIEKEILKILANTTSTTQKKIGKYWVDFLVKNTVIEVQGSYWHCDPEMFTKGPINSIQTKNKKRDLEKNAYLLKKGYNVIYIWEKDIKEKYEQICQELNAVLNRNIKYNNRAKSVELLRDNTEVTEKHSVP